MMRLLPIFCVAAVCLSSNAQAEHVRKMAWYSLSTINTACRDAGGEPSASGNTYSCTKANCDGNGGTCKVECNSRQQTCTGTTPSRKRRWADTPTSILSNGMRPANRAAPAHSGQ